MSTRNEHIVGTRQFQFRWLKGWGKLPPDVTLGDVPAVAVDSRDRLFIFHRGEPPIIVLDQDGTFVSSWGDGLFKRPHGIFIAPDDSVYCIDDEGQTVRKFTADGKVELEIKGKDQSGITGYRPGFPESITRSAPPFCYPTGASVSPHSQQVIVTDGYGNARVHNFSPEGKLVRSFGEPGHAPSQFVTPHGVLIDPDGTCYVCDRENERIQIFNTDGKFLRSWPNLNCPNNIVRDRDGYYYVAELGRVLQGTPEARHVVKNAIRARITIRTADGTIVAEWGARNPLGDGAFFAPHGIAIDSRRNLYVGEVVAAHSCGLAPLGQPSLHKFVRLVD